ncbi:MAG: ATP-grasp domain-containing protein [Stellaceae bacterium]
MKIFAFEYVTAGGWREIAAPQSLIAEGAMMLRALVRDLARLPGLEIVVAGDPALATATPGAAVATVAASDLWGSWRAIAARCDLAWPIAPETGGLLEEVVRLAAAAGCGVLASRFRALAIARSKRATAAWLGAHGVPVVPTVGLDETLPAAAAGWVIKPDDGAGAVDTALVAEREAVAGWRARPDSKRFVAQPFLAGDALSLSMLTQDGKAWLLACNRQDVSIAGSVFHYHGGVVGGAEARRAVLAPLANRIAALLPELWGYVGVDLIDGAAGPVVLEINPRLTTSYIGLADSIGLNPAELVLALRRRPLAQLIRPLAPHPVALSVAAS